LDWLYANACSNATEDGSGSSRRPEGDRLSSLQSQTGHGPEPRRKWNLLLAEDNLPDALLVREAIRRESLPIEVHLAPDGQKALDFIAAAEEDPDAPCPQLLLLDLNLPKVDGFKVLERLRASERLKDVPVLIVSSSDAASDRALAAEMGAHYFLKPPSYAEYMKLGGVLKRLIGAPER
jgi:DNA-binding response OmpR family regulator